MVKVANTVVGMAGLFAALTGCGAAETVESVAPTSMTPQGSSNEVNVVDSFAYTLYTHCGIRFARFDRQTWATKPRSDGSGNPPPGWDNPSQAGTMYLLANGRAGFRTPGLPDLRFHRTRAEPPMCA